MGNAGQKRVLVVDDDEIILEVLENVLTNSGYDVDVCEDGIQVMDMMKSGDKPSLIVLDVMMDFMNGLEVFEQLKNDPEYADIPVFIITAMASERVKQKALQLGAVEYFKKPINLDYFMNVVKKQLDE